MWSEERIKQKLEQSKQRKLTVAAAERRNRHKVCPICDLKFGSAKDARDHFVYMATYAGRGRATKTTPGHGLGKFGCPVCRKHLTVDHMTMAHDYEEFKNAAVLLFMGSVK